MRKIKVMIKNKNNSNYKIMNNRKKSNKLGWFLLLIYNYDDIIVKYFIHLFISKINEYYFEILILKHIFFYYYF